MYQSSITQPLCKAFNNPPKRFFNCFYRLRLVIRMNINNFIKLNISLNSLLNSVQKKYIQIYSFNLQTIWY